MTKKIQFGQRAKDRVVAHARENGLTVRELMGHEPQHDAREQLADQHQLTETKASYRAIEVAANERPRMTALETVFDDQDEAEWIDTWGYVSPRGNELVAARMASALTRLRVGDATAE